MFLRRRVPENGPLKAAVIGAGVFGHHHATKYKALGHTGKNVELFAIADPNPDMRAKAKAHHGCSVVGDWRELLGKVDLVSICSPAITHAEMVRAFLNAGAHVLVEKPIATTMEEASELVELSRKTGMILSVGHQERFVFARTGLLDHREIPLEITCWRQGPWTGRGDDVSVVLDLMIHDLDLVHTLVPGEVVDVRAEGLIEYGPHADEVFALLRFAGGTIAKLETSRVATERKRGLRAVYADGVSKSISFPAMSIIPRRARWAPWNWAIPWASRWRALSMRSRPGWMLWSRPNRPRKRWKPRFGSRTRPAWRCLCGRRRTVLRQAAASSHHRQPVENGHA